MVLRPQQREAVHPCHGVPTQHNGLPPLHNANSYFFAPPVKNSGRRTDFRGSPGRLETALIPSITRMFKVAFTPRHQARKPATLKDLATIRKALLLGLEDCTSEGAARLRTKVAQAKTPQELWMLRNDAYQLISQQHNQSVAAERINDMIHFFEGWLDPKQIARIK